MRAIFMFRSFIVRVGKTSQVSVKPHFLKRERRALAGLLLTASACAWPLPVEQQYNMEAKQQKSS